MKFYKSMLTLTLVLATGFIFGCGGAATNANKTNAPANTNANAGKPANSTAAATPAASDANTASNPDLDFTLVNKTGYGIKQIYISPTSVKEWSDDAEILKGRSFADGATMEVKFHPKATAANWDIMVEWTDGSPSDEWDKLNLTKIDKVTLKYDKAADKTTAEIE
jgi:hypothetical protein